MISAEAKRKALLRGIPKWRTSPVRSSPRKRGGGFTLEVQHLGESFGWGSEVKAFTRGIIVGADQGVELLVRNGGEVCLSRKEAAESADRVLHAALLPR